MSTRAVFLISLALIALTLGAGLYYYDGLPAVMAGHWDATGVVNGTIGKFWGVSLLPLLMFVLLWILIIIPRIEPMQTNFAQFRSKYNAFIVFIMLFFTIIQLAVLAVNLGAQFNIAVAIMPLIGILFFYIGVLMPDTRRNFFVGIRTPWTLASDAVWEKTHRMGGLLFKALGVLAILTIFSPTHAVIAFIIPTIVVAIGLVLYSYVAYRELGMRTS